MRIWDAQSGREIAKIDGSLLSLPASKVLLTVNKWADRSIIRRWDTESGRELQALEMQDGLTHQIQFSPDRKQIAMHNFNRNRVFLWEVESGRKLQELSGKVGSFSPDGKKFTTSDYDRTSITRIWDIESGRKSKVEGNGARFSSDGRKIATGGGSHDYNTRIWDTNSGRELRKLEGMPDRFFPDSKKIVTYYARGSDSGGTTYRIWDVDSGRELLKLEENVEGRLAKFSPDNKKFVTEFTETVPSATGGGRTTTGYTILRIWEAESCRKLQEIRAKSYYGSFYFSSDGSKFVTYNVFQRIIQIWDVKSGKELHSFEGQTFFPTRERITKISATSGGKGSIGENQPIQHGITRIWDIDSGKELQQFEGEFLDFSPDEKKVATASEDGTVRIWDAISGKELHKLRHSYRGPITDVSLSAGGTGLITDAPFDIFSAAEKGTVQDMQSCVSQGASVRMKTPLGETPLHRAALYNSNVEVVKYLVSQGADVSAKDSGGVTPLHQAALGNSNVEIVKYLVSQGADIHAKTQLGGTPLHQAAGYNSNVEILKYLISQGADVNAKYNNGKTPLDLADTEEKKSILREVGRRPALPQRTPPPQEAERKPDGISEELRIWTSAPKGTHTLKAFYVKSDEKSVTLKKENGEIITVDLSKLSQDDRDYAKQRQNVEANAKERKIVNPTLPPSSRPGSTRTPPRPPDSGMGGMGGGMGGGMFYRLGG